jgi:NifB/MoaA-like Fe-S oxidoreductase
MVKITEVLGGSIADKNGILAEDMLIAINDNEINDVLDYRFYLTERKITLTLDRGGERYSVNIKKRRV